MHRVNLLKSSGYLAYFALSLSVVSIAIEVHIIPLAIFILSVVVGIILDGRQDQSPLIDPLFLFFLVITGIVISLVGITYKNLFNRALGILLIIISAKLISPKKARDMLQIYMLNFFLLTGSAVTRLDLEFGLLVLVQTYIFLFGLVLIYGSREQEEMFFSHLLKLAGWSTVVTLSLIPATVILFLIIPRPTMTLLAWGGGVVSKTGFSDTVTPGSVEQIKLDNSPAFRVRWLEGERPEHIMWRGLVYDSYYQGSWERTYEDDIITPIMGTARAMYEVVLEPSDTRYLFSTGIPYSVWGRSLRTLIKPGYTIESRRYTDQRIIYRVSSYIVEDIPRDLDPVFYLNISTNLQKELHEMTGDLIQETDYGTCLRVRDFLTNGFRYDLSPGTPSGDPVLFFLKESKKGHCEYFASAMTLILRSMGIPTRMVGGYLQGDWNDLGEYFLVRQSDAHTWVEAWIEDRGWVMFDPTPPAPLVHGQGFREKLLRIMDLLRLRWYYWVIDYNVNKQMDLARMTRDFFISIQQGDSSLRLSGSLPDPKRIIPLAGFVLLLILLVAGYKIYRKRPRSWGEKFVLLMKKKGYERNPGQTIMELAASISDETPILRQRAINFTEKYYRFDFGKQGNDKELEGLYLELKDEIKYSRVSGRDARL